MGLDTTHDAWHGAYSAFHRWRKELARVAGLPPLELMEGFYSNGGDGDPFWATSRLSDLEQWRIKQLREALPIKWESLKPDPLHELLYHSDCDGEIPWQNCKAIAKRLKELIPLLPKEPDSGHIGTWSEKTQQFADGLMRAYKAKKNLGFH